MPDAAGVVMVRTDGAFGELALKKPGMNSGLKYKSSAYSLVVIPGEWLGGIHKTTFKNPRRAQTGGLIFPCKNFLSPLWVIRVK
jgi:hypothetical protein